MSSTRHQAGRHQRTGIDHWIVQVRTAGVDGNGGVEGISRGIDSDSALDDVGPELFQYLREDEWLCDAHDGKGDGNIARGVGLAVRRRNGDPEEIGIDVGQRRVIVRHCAVSYVAKALMGLGNCCPNGVGNWQPACRNNSTVVFDDPTVELIRAMISHGSR